MGNVLGVINLVNGEQFLKELTEHRCLASVPFAGRYRLIDFTLSNMIHAGITQVAVCTKDKFRSIMDHLGSGKEWDLDRRNGGLSILPPIHADERLKGDLDYFYNHLEYFEYASADTVLLSPGHHVSKIDFNQLLLSHQLSEADITVVYKDYQGQPVDKPIFHTCILDEKNRVKDIQLFTYPQIRDHVCLDTFIMSKQLFIQLIRQCVEQNEHDFIKDAIKANLNHLHVQGIAFTGEMNFIHSIESYYAENMRFLEPETIERFLYNKWEIFTKVKHEPPIKISEDSKVTRSFIANGCDIQGTVENSILFRGVKIHKDAVVKNCIIMQKGEIEAGVYIQNMILDKQVRVRENQIIVSDGIPLVIPKAKSI